MTSDSSTSDQTTSDSIYHHNVEEIDTIAIVQKLASNHPYLARNEALHSNSDWTSDWTTDWLVNQVN